MQGVRPINSERDIFGAGLLHRMRMLLPNCDKSKRYGRTRNVQHTVSDRAARFVDDGDREEGCLIDASTYSHLITWSRLVVRRKSENETR